MPQRQSEEASSFYLGDTSRQQWNSNPKKYSEIIELELPPTQFLRTRDIVTNSVHDTVIPPFWKLQLLKNLEVFQMRHV